MTNKNTIELTEYEKEINKGITNPNNYYKYIGIGDNENEEVWEYKETQYVFKKGEVKEGWLWPKGFRTPNFIGSIERKSGYYLGYKDAMEMAFEYLTNYVDDQTGQKKGTHKREFNKWLEDFKIEKNCKINGDKWN